MTNCSSLRYVIFYNLMAIFAIYKHTIKKIGREQGGTFLQTQYHHREIMKKFNNMKITRCIDFTQSFTGVVRK